MSRTARLLPVALVAFACDPGGFKVQVTETDRTLRAVFVSSESSALIVGGGGTVLDYDGEGFVDTSTDADPGPRVPGFFACGRANGRSFVAGDDGTMVFRAGAGPYVFDNERITARVLTMFAPTPSVVYAGTESGNLFRRVATDEDAWERVNVPVPGGAKITAGWASGEQNVALATDQGVVLDRVGGDWTAETVVTDTSTTPLPLFGVWSSTAGADLFAVGLGGAIYRRPSTDLTWVREESPTTQDLYGVYGNASDRAFAVGANGTILRYDGATWRAVPSGTSEDLFGVHGTPEGTLIVAVGARGTVVTLEEE